MMMRGQKLQRGSAKSRALRRAPPIESSRPNPEAGQAPPIELVFGFVAPTGVDLVGICDALEAQLKLVQYETRTISLSELIAEYAGLGPFRNYYERVNALMNQGNALRRTSERPEIVAAMGVFELRRARFEITGNASVPSKKRKIAYFIKSFKRPEEVSLYREIYGKAFTLISVYSPRVARVRTLVKRCNGGRSRVRTAEERAVRLINRDHLEEGVDSGQRVGRTFPLADFFLTAGSRPQIDEQLRRLVRLTFGDPYISPTVDEQAMFFAQAAALRSLDLSRQVGAAIVAQDGEILGTGCNEVPKFGGGLYWAEDNPRSRDYELGFDSNVKIKTEIVEDAVQRLRANRWLVDDPKNRNDEQLARVALEGEDGKKGFFRDSKLFDVIEFGRAVHAEMAAITQAAKVGVALRDSRLFCTTFPCHLCARHIVASGIRDVVFIEPYEKSRTEELYADSISVEPNEPSERRVNFRAFVGVAPRRYIDLFQLTISRKKEDGSVLSQSDIADSPRIKRRVFTYPFIEADVVEGLETYMEQPVSRRERK